MSDLPGSDYKIYDIISRIIPGGIAVYVLISISFIAEETADNPLNQMLNSPAYLIIFVGFGLLAGEIIQFSRNKLNPVPLPLRREIYRQSRNENFLPTHDLYLLRFWEKISTGRSGKVVVPIAKRSPLDLFVPPQTLTTKTKEGFWKDFKYKFSVDDDFDRVKDVYGMLIAYLEPSMTSDLRRSRAVVDFMNNLIIAVLFLFYAIVVNTPVSDGLGWTQVIVFVIISIIIFPGVIALFAFIERHYVNRLLLEYFYTRRLEEENQESGREFRNSN